MFHNSHDLDNIITLFDDARQYIISEIIIRTDIRFLGCNSHMALVDAKAFWFFWVLVFKYVTLKFANGKQDKKIKCLNFIEFAIN